MAEVTNKMDRVNVCSYANKINEKIEMKDVNENTAQAENHNIPIVKYKVEVLETLRKVVEIELPLGSGNEARKIVMEKYYNEEIVLSADDHFDTEFHYLGRK